VGDDDQTIDPGTDDCPKGSRKDLLASEADELLRHVRTEPIAGAPGEDHCMDAHRQRIASRGSVSSAAEVRRTWIAA
jgi:hypothetical protein